MGDIENGWKIFKKIHVASESDQHAVTQIKFAFFVGAFQHHHVLSEAAKLENNLAIMTIEAVDAEIENFQMTMSQVTRTRAGGALPPALVMKEEIKPIPMILYCPKCHAQHIESEEEEKTPHVRHVCGSCLERWRPAEIPTAGVASLVAAIP